MAKECCIVAIKATAELYDLLNGGGLRLGDYVFVPKGAPFGDTLRGIDERKRALAERKAGKRAFVTAPPFMAAALLRQGCKPQPFWLRTAVIRGGGAAYVEHSCRVLRSERTGGLYLGLNELTQVRQFAGELAYEGQELVLEVVGFADGFKEPAFAKVWAQGPDGQWIFAAVEGDVIPMRPAKVALFEIVNLELTSAQRAAATKVALTCFK